MNVDIRYQPAFATIFASLLPGESIIAEAGAMASMSPQLEMKARFNGGFFTAILRKIFGGETLFVNEFSCPRETNPGELVLTQSSPGDIAEIDLQGNTLLLTSGSFIACTPGVKLGLGFAGFASWLGKEGLFRLSVSGHGKVWIGGYGGVLKQNIQNELVVDTGHLLAYEPTISLSISLSGGIFSSFFSGEGFVSRIRGQGDIYLQSRSLDGLTSWTNKYL
ncbi:MAG: TIGR00266 family protein [Myxococcota bacterium]|nr:TIGR00266 family protein [Myxococcota bacterium]